MANAKQPPQGDAILAARDAVLSVLKAIPGAVGTLSEAAHRRTAEYSLRKLGTSMESALAAIRDVDHLHRYATPIECRLGDLIDQTWHRLSLAVGLKVLAAWREATEPLPEGGRLRSVSETERRFAILQGDVVEFLEEGVIPPDLVAWQADGDQWVGRINSPRWPGVPDLHLLASQVVNETARASAIQPASTETLDPADLGSTEEMLLRALGTGQMKGPELAKAANLDHQCCKHPLAELVKRKILVNESRKGYRRV